MTLIHDVEALYREANDYSRGLLNDGFFTRLHIDENGVQSDVLRQPVREILGAARASASMQTFADNENSTPRRRSENATQTRGAAPTLTDFLYTLRGQKPLGFK